MGSFESSEHTGQPKCGVVAGATESAAPSGTRSGVKGMRARCTTCGDPPCGVSARHFALQHVGTRALALCCSHPESAKRASSGTRAHCARQVAGSPPPPWPLTAPAHHHHHHRPAIGTSSGAAQAPMDKHTRRPGPHLACRRCPPCQWRPLPPAPGRVCPGPPTTPRRPAPRQSRGRAPRGGARPATCLRSAARQVHRWLPWQVCAPTPAPRAKPHDWLVCRCPQGPRSLTQVAAELLKQLQLAPEPNVGHDPRPNGVHAPAPAAGAQSQHGAGPQRALLSTSLPAHSTRRKSSTPPRTERRRRTRGAPWT